MGLTDRAASPRVSGLISSCSTGPKVRPLRPCALGLQAAPAIPLCPYTSPRTRPLGSAQMFDALANLDSLPDAPQVDFTYAHPGQSIFRRSVIRAVETLTGSQSSAVSTSTGPGATACRAFRSFLPRCAS